MKKMLCAGYFCKKNEFERYSKNIFSTEKLLQKFVFHQELKRTGIWLDIPEIKSRASRTLKILMDSNLIQNGLIVDGVLEYINEQIA